MLKSLLQNQRKIQIKEHVVSELQISLPTTQTRSDAET
jgi:hypothetical protein